MVFFSTSISAMMIAFHGIEVAMSDNYLFAVFALSLMNLLFSGSRWAKIRVDNSKK